MKARIILLATALIIFLAMFGIWYLNTQGEKIIGPVTLAQASDWQLPLYTVDPKTNLTQRLYLIDRGDELKMETYFYEDRHDPSVSIAKLTMYSLLKAGPGELLKDVTVNWANNQRGYICRLPSTISNRKPFKASPYKTCLYWIGNDNKQYILFTVLTEDETLTFVNSLVRLN